MNASKSPVWSSLGILIGAIVAILAIVRGKWQLPLLILAVGIWAFWLLWPIVLPVLQEYMSKRRLEISRRKKRKDLMPDIKDTGLECVATIFTIVHTSADADRGIFPKPEACASFFALDPARDALSALVRAEKENLNPRYNVFIEDEEDAWEANEDDYAAGLFTRYEIVSSPLFHMADKKNAAIQEVRQVSKGKKHYDRQNHGEN